MTLILDLSPDVARELEALAARHGLNASDLAADVVAGFLSAWEEEAEADAADARRVLATSDPAQRRSLADLRAHIEAQSEVQTATAQELPQEQRAAA